MKIAVAYQDGEIYGHFGHCPMFAVYEYGDYVSDCKKTLVDTSMLSGHQAMASKMKELDVAAVMAGNMGGEAKAELLSLGIVPIAGYSGDADTAADLLVTGQLPVNGVEGGCGCSGSCGGCSGSCGDEEGDCGCGWLPLIRWNSVTILHAICSTDFPAMRMPCKSSTSTNQAFSLL